jgi:hypothetical protein
VAVATDYAATALVHKAATFQCNTAKPRGFDDRRSLPAAGLDERREKRSVDFAMDQGEQRYQVFMSVVNQLHTCIATCPSPCRLLLKLGYISTITAVICDFFNNSTPLTRAIPYNEVSNIFTEVLIKAWARWHLEEGVCLQDVENNIEIIAKEAYDNFLAQSDHDPDR